MSANPILKNRLSALDARYRHKKPETEKRLRVFYGWAKVNKIRRKEAISVIFENDRGREGSTIRFISRMQKTVYVRDQTEKERIGADGSARMFSEYSIFMSDRKICNSLERALIVNFDADKNHLSIDERSAIKDKLRIAYLESHPDYKEPILQLHLQLE